MIVECEFSLGRFRDVFLIDIGFCLGRGCLVRFVWYILGANGWEFRELTEVVFGGVSEEAEEVIGCCLLFVRGFCLGLRFVG